VPIQPFFCLFQLINRTFFPMFLPPNFLSAYTFLLPPSSNSPWIHPLHQFYKYVCHVTTLLHDWDPWDAMARLLIEVVLREVSCQVYLIGRKIKFATNTNQEMLSLFPTRRWLKWHDKTSCVWTIIIMIIVMYWLVFTCTLSTQTTWS
jgi:hypothetical protein